MKRRAGKLWLCPEKLILASRSKARISMLTHAGVPIEIVPADIDERAIQDACSNTLDPAGIAIALAEAKAKAVSSQKTHRLVLGSDQTLDVDGRVYAKASDRTEALERLKAFSGRHHLLHSAYCFARNGAVVLSGVRTAKVSVRTLSDDFIEAYLDENGSDILGSVAVYEVEGLGVHLFDQIDGDWFTVQGLPLLDVIAFLQAKNWLLR